MYEIEIDHRQHLLKVVLSGFWTPEIMAAYVRAVRAKMAELQGSGGCRRILIDMSTFAIQTREIAEAHADHLRAAKARGGVRAAVVVQSALSKLQAARVAHDTGHRTFDDRSEALAWLLSDD